MGFKNTGLSSRHSAIVGSLYELTSGIALARSQAVGNRGRVIDTNVTVTTENIISDEPSKQVEQTMYADLGKATTLRRRC
jgi:hypothetical protein